MPSEFLIPQGLRDRHTKLQNLVRIAVETGEDPLILAQSAGVSPSAFVRALPAEVLAKFIPGGVERLTTQEIMLKLAANHALDVAVQGIIDPAIDAKTKVILARDMMDRGSLVGAKKAAPTSNVQLSDQSLAKLVELERAFHGSGLAPDVIPDAFQPFHRSGKGGGADAVDGRTVDPEAWAGPDLPVVRSLDFDLD